MGRSRAPLRWGVLLLVLFCSPSLLPAQSDSGVVLAQQEPSFRSTSSELVVLPVVVKDKQGRYVSDLVRERFVVFDNARRMPIEFFSNEDTPVTIGLIIDASSSMRPKLAEVIASAAAFAKSSNPNDEIFAIRFNDDVAEVIRDRRFVPASDVKDLEAAVSSLVPQGRTALYDAVIAGLDRLRDGSKPRKALLVISDGGDNASQAKLDDVLSRARLSNASIYTIGIYDPDDEDKNPRALRAIAHATGGERFEPQSPGALMQVCERIAREIRSGYTLGYVPPDRDGIFHRVRIAIEPPLRNADIRTRPGYFAAGVVSRQ
jgi:VWFA-related protein